MLRQTAMAANPTVRLKPHEGRRVRAGAPWIFSNEIQMDASTKALAPGTLVNAMGDDGRCFGTGTFNPKSLIAIRLLDSAADADIGEAFFATHLARALARRGAFYDEPYYRLVHAEGDFLPGLVIDRFGDTLVVQIGTAGMEALIDPLLAALNGLLAPARVLLKNDAPARALEGLDACVRVAKGSFDGPIAVHENGLRYFAAAQGGQKTGWYYDQRDNRAFMAKLARGKSVLDAFCYAGGFAVAAAKAGAAEATGIDSSAAALALANDAAAANGVGKTAKFVKADAMEELARLAGQGERFDVVIADPPPFVRAKKDLEPGAKAYRKLARLAASVTAESGFLFLASCSHNMPADRFAFECAAGIARAGRRAAQLRHSGTGPDHPICPMLPETAYLKALVYALD